MRTRDFCRCGAQLTLSGPESDRAALEAARGIFLASHRGEGHEPCDAQTAFRARLRGEAVSNVDPSASQQSPQQIMYRVDCGRRVPPKPAAE